VSFANEIQTEAWTPLARRKPLRALLLSCHCERMQPARAAEVRQSHVFNRFEIINTQTEPIKAFFRLLPQLGGFVAMTLIDYVPSLSAQNDVRTPSGCEEKS
jgi:hypothetical protein